MERDLYECVETGERSPALYALLGPGYVGKHVRWLRYGVPICTWRVEGRGWELVRAVRAVDQPGIDGEDTYEVIDLRREEAAP
jgi:hypothetical protein